MQHSFIETALGFIIIVIAIFFLIFAYRTGDKFSHNSGYRIYGNFQNVEGISKGSDVMLAGVKIGVVDDVNLDKASLIPTLWLQIDLGINLPIDSRAAIVTSGLLGGKFIAITQGISEEMLPVNGQIKYTQSSINLEGLIGKFMYSAKNK
jgi:phospholipid/cholesterol/gamma-HCH transport system substrate-binding protein